MRRLSPVLAIVLTALPLMGAVPASRIKEPNAIFTYTIDGERVRSTLFDRLQERQIDYLDTRTTLPLVATGSAGSNDTMQFSSATRKIYAIVHNRSGYDGSIIDETLPYDIAIIETDFNFSEPTTVFSCNDCHTEQWLVHPSKPVLYVSLPSEYNDGADEFRSAKLIEVALSPSIKTRVIGRIPAHAELRMTPDGEHVFVFSQATGSRDPYGAVVRITPSSRRRVQTIINLPITNFFKNDTSVQSTDLSPDARELAFHMGIIDVRTKHTDSILQKTKHDIDNVSIGWSRDATRILFQMMNRDGDDRIEVPLVYDRATKREWVLDVQDANLLDWSPAQSAILMRKHGDVGYYDLIRRAWVHVAEASEGSWVTLPTKRVQKR